MLEELQKYVGVESVIPTIGVFVLSYLYYRTNNKNFPPGPKGLPILGCVTKLGEHPSNTLNKLAEEYGQVFSIQIGQRNWVILNNYESIHQALLKKGDDFMGRPNLLLTQQMGEGLGVIFRDHGPTFHTQRKFAVATLKEFGVGKKRLEELVMDEVTYFAEEIDARDGKPFNCQTLMAKVTGNIICELVLGSRLPYDNETYSRLVSCLDLTFFKPSTAPSVLALLVAPVVRFLPGFRATYQGFSDDLNKVFEILTVLLDQHKKNYDDEDIRDFVDAFLKEMKTNKDPSFKERQVFQFMRELFVAGSANISTTLRWCFLCFANYPEYQEKIMKEIDDAIGDSGTPSMKHRDEMPFTCAFIEEIMRHRTLVPLSMPHKTTADTTLQGYEIPKNTPVLTNLWAVHHDPKHFKEPEVFRPERFLDGDGSFINDKHVIPFSSGPRTCLGEQLSKIQIFLFLTAIVQKFKIVCDQKNPIPRFEDGVHGVLFVPPPFEVTFESR